MNEAQINREKQTELLRECECFERRTHDYDDEGGGNSGINDENGIRL